MAATDIHLRQLNHFLAVVEEGTFGKAAERVHLSQPALSKSLRQLEERLQVSLIDRTPQGVIPTAFGLAFIEHAKAIRAEMANAVNEMDALRGVRSGAIAVGAGPSVAASVLPEVVARLTAERPDITVNVVEGLTDTLGPALMCGELDLVIGARLAIDRTEETVRERLYVDRCGIVCRPDHPLLERPDMTLDELRRFPWILTARNEGLRMIFEEIFRTRELDPPLPVISTNSMPFMLGALAKGDLLGFLPQVVVRGEVARGALRIVDHPECFSERPMLMIHRKKRSISPLARALMRLIREVCADYGL